MALTHLSADEATVDHDAAILLAAAQQVEDASTREALMTMAASLSRGLVVASADQAVSPRQAGEMLGVSRQFVDRLIVEGHLPATTKPGSRHKLIAVHDIMKLDRSRREGRSAVEDLVAELLDSGDEY